MKFLIILLIFFFTNIANAFYVSYGYGEAYKINIDKEGWVSEIPELEKGEYAGDLYYGFHTNVPYWDKRESKFYIGINLSKEDKERHIGNVKSFFSRARKEIANSYKKYPNASASQTMNVFPRILKDRNEKKFMKTWFNYKNKTMGAFVLESYDGNAGSFCIIYQIIIQKEKTAKSKLAMTCDHNLIDKSLSTYWGLSPNYLKIKK